ncbi:MAG: hypothetical protein IPH07_24440 [Deltaproteobacteria bacterium]|nr:hypothetical protein [Deltaproteobacteria bacterium]
MITLRSLADIDFVAACAAALLAGLLILVPALAPLAARVPPELLLSFAGGAIVRWALRQPPSPPAAGALEAAPA